MVWLWLIISGIISLIGLVLFVCAGYTHLFGTDYTDRGGRTEARWAMVGLGGLLLSWLWPLVLPVAILVGAAFIAKGAFGKEES